MDISRNIFICKKKIIEWIEKIPIQKKEANKNIPFETTLQISGYLLRNLSITEESVGLIANFSYRDARSYYLYAVLSEVLSSCMSSMRVVSWVEESEEEAKFDYPRKNKGNETISGNKIEHLLNESIVDEFEVRFRKLQEYLCNLICFSESNDQKYYQLYFASEALSDIKYANQDISEFFGNPMENFNYQSKCLLNRCKELIKDVDKNKCWFLNPNVNFNSESIQSTMSSFRYRYKKAILSSNSGEKILLGPTYKVGYGGSSKSAHALVEEHLKDYTLGDVRHKIEKIPLICLSILNRIFEISKIECPKNFKEILECASSGEGATKGIFNVTQGDFEVGDLITTGGSDVAEILRIHESSYGYKSYFVKYLVNSKIKEIPEEWLPPKYITAYLLKKSNTRSLFTHNVASLLGKESVDWMDKKSDAELYEFAKETIYSMAKEGQLKLFFMPR